MTFATRFAPSPTGPLHLGHAYSAILAHDMARAAGGLFHLRIDDIDQSRARREWDAQIRDDLAWLGLTWDSPVERQSTHFGSYRAAIDALAARGLAYPCSCTRRDIEAAASAPQEGAPQFGPDGRIYPGTCRGRPMSGARDSDAIRLDLSRCTAPELAFTETGPAHAGTHIVTLDALKRDVGDPVLARPNMAASYHLSIVLDDAAQGITHVVRGEDLFEATWIQRLLQHLLDLPTPTYHHHALIRDDTGKRLAKRDDARAIARYRDEGATPADIRRMVGL
ncbi:tRNA glutamyl-Q(34) synthetase GluQRS [Pseudooceanicola sp. LIPI14-2-Ac024]|uniref:tRNA glutamyl-Q(34) synthetase GluQRS n=1 Tax=Pseudooceanicola sp. LIPI14-2-Ac024 TaxID=3344875 RepID=UPI0035D0FB29